MKRIKYMILALGIITGFGLATVPVVVGAQNVFVNCPAGSTSEICKGNPNDFTNFIKTIVNTLLFVLGAVSVVTIIIAGIRYTTSQGDPGAVKIAKDTLLYAVIGLVVAIMAFAIVNFVIGRFFK